MKSTKVQDIMAARNKRARETFQTVTEEQKARWKEQEPTEAQVEFLAQAKVSHDVIATLSKYDASELIEKIIVEREARNAGPATDAQKRGLELWGFTKEEVDSLTYAEAREIYNGLPRKK